MERETHRDRNKETERQRELLFFCGFIVYFVYQLPVQLEFVPVSNRVLPFSGETQINTLSLSQPALWERQGKTASLVGKAR